MSILEKEKRLFEYLHEYRIATQNQLIEYIKKEYKDINKQKLINKLKTEFKKKFKECEIKNNEDFIEIHIKTQDGSRRNIKFNEYLLFFIAESDSKSISNSDSKSISNIINAIEKINWHNNYSMELKLFENIIYSIVSFESGIHFSSLFFEISEKGKSDSIYMIKETPRSWLLLIILKQYIKNYFYSKRIILI
jgi:hypothetical protein